VKKSPNEKKMKQQHTAFSIDKKMQISAEANAHVGTRVDLAATLGLSVSKLNMKMSKWSETEKS
jgi:DNA-binding NtrC family response regulator